MRYLLALLAASLLAPGAQACSIALTDLADVDIQAEHVVVQRGTRVAVIDWTTGIERTVSEDFFPRFEAGPGGRALVAAQEGLGADCSGDQYVALYGPSGNEVERWDGDAAIASWPAGILIADGAIEAYSWTGGDAQAPAGTVHRDAAFAVSPDGQTLVAARDDKARVIEDGGVVATLTRPGAGLEAVAAGNGAAYLSSAWEGGQEQAVLQWWDGDEVWSFDLPGSLSWPGSIVPLGDEYWFAAGGDLIHFDTSDRSFTARTFDDLFVGGVGSDGAVLAIGLAQDPHIGEGAGVLRIDGGTESYRSAPDGRGLWIAGTVPSSQTSHLDIDGTPGAPTGDETTPGPGALLVGALLVAFAGRRTAAGKP